MTRNSDNLIDPQDETALEDVMGELGRLPLAILQSAAYLSVEHITIADYLQNYRKVYDESIWIHKPAEDEFYEPVGITLTMTLRRIQDLEIPLHMILFHCILGSRLYSRFIVEEQFSIQG